MLVNTVSRLLFFILKMKNNKNNAIYWHWTVRSLRKPFGRCRKSCALALIRVCLYAAKHVWKQNTYMQTLREGFVKAPEAGKNGGLWKNALTVETLDIVFEIYKSSVWIEMINGFFKKNNIFFTNFIRYFRNKWIFSLLKCYCLKFSGENQTKI